MHKFCTSIVQYVYSACTETDGVYVRVACVCVCLYLPLQVDISPFSTSTDSILKPCALGILSLHSDRRNETDALEHVALFGNLHNRDHTESQREKNRLAHQYMLSTVLDQIKECHDSGGWLITFKGNKEPTVCIGVLMSTVLDYEEVRKTELIKSGSTPYPMCNCLCKGDSLSQCSRDGSCASAPRTVEGMWEGPYGGSHEMHSCSSKTVIPALATVPGVVRAYEFCLLDWLHNVPKGTGLNLKDGVFAVILSELGARGVRELNNIFADEWNKYTGSKLFRQGIGSLANEQAYEVSTKITHPFEYHTNP